MLWPLCFLKSCDQYGALVLCAPRSTSGVIIRNPSSVVTTVSHRSGIAGDHSHVWRVWYLPLVYVLQAGCCGQRQQQLHAASHVVTAYNVAKPGLAQWVNETFIDAKANEHWRYIFTPSIEYIRLALLNVW